ncbi:hypothetical protein JTB14_015503 [Gonioctena quinquepunctata]|nr:hypothetical protein JTB14_015503 [Gonioctena quinquepunctata]
MAPSKHVYPEFNNITKNHYSIKCYTVCGKYHIKHCSQLYDEEFSNMEIPMVVNAFKCREDDSSDQEESSTQHISKPQRMEIHMDEAFG